MEAGRRGGCVQKYDLMQEGRSTGTAGKSARGPPNTDRCEPAGFLDGFVPSCKQDFPLVTETGRSDFDVSRTANE